MEINKCVVVTSQRAATTQDREYRVMFIMTEINVLVITSQLRIQKNMMIMRCQIFNEINSLMIIKVKYEEK